MGRKGPAKHSKETREKIAQAIKGRVPWNKGKNGVQKAWNKGVSSSKEIREQITEVRTNLGSTKDELKTAERSILTLNGKISALQNQKETMVAGL